MQDFQVGLGQVTGGAELVGFTGLGVERRGLGFTGERRTVTSVGNVVADDARSDLILLGQLNHLLQLQGGWDRRVGGAKQVEGDNGCDDRQPDQGHFYREAVRRKVLERAAFEVVFGIRHLRV